jgi:phosphoribosylanthranilate isomerase
LSGETARTRIKFCGLTSVAELEAAVAAGADAAGVILAESPRRVTLERARELSEAVPAFVSLVGVVADQPAEARALRELGAVPQLHGDEPPGERLPYIKTFHLEAGGPFDPAAFERFAARYPGATLLVDTASGAKRGGTGIAFDWNVLRAFTPRRRIIVSGGLTPQNVGACIRAIRPYGVDARSGIETGDAKDRVKMDAFVRAVREADASA